MPRGKPGDEFSKSHRFGFGRSVDQNVALGRNTRKNINAFQKRFVLHEHDVGLGNGFSQTDFFFVDAAEGRHRRAGAFRAETRKGLSPVAFGEGCDTEHFSRGHHALATAAMDTDLIHSFSPEVLTAAAFHASETPLPPLSASRETAGY